MISSAMVQELLQACLNVKQQHDQSIKEAQQAMEQAKIREKAAEKSKELAEEYHKMIGQQLSDIFNQYKQAVNNIPTEWDTVGIFIVKDLVNVVMNVGVAFASRYARIHAVAPDQGQFQETQKPNSAFNSSQIDVCVLSGEFMVLLGKMKATVDGEGGLRREQIYDEKTGEVNTNWIKKHLGSPLAQDKHRTAKNCAGKSPKYLSKGL